MSTEPDARVSTGTISRRVLRSSLDACQPDPELPIRGLHYCASSIESEDEH